MPQDGLFFRVLRRFNLIVWALVGIAALMVAATYLPELPWMTSLIAKVGGDTAVPVAQAPAKTDGYELQAEYYPSGEAYPPIARDKVLFVLRKSMPPVDPTTFLPNKEEVVNLMVIDEDGQGHWLFQGHDRLIVSREAVYQGPQPAGAEVATDARPIVALVMQVVEADTNKDGKLGEDDAISLYVWRKGDSKAEKLLTSDTLMGVGRMGENRYLVNFDKGKTKMAAVYSLPDFKLISATPLPEAP